MILSVSRRTDIPAFFSDWFMKRIKEGYLMVRNPMNYHQVSKISLSPEVVDCFVFWTKNPAEMIGKLDLITHYNYYFQFTITSYNDTLELNVPKKTGVITTFKRLSDLIGKNRVIWRYDPILFTDSIDESYHYKYFEKLASKLKDFTDKCVISFLDTYINCERNLRHSRITILDEDNTVKVSKLLNDIAMSNKIQLATCAEDIDLSSYGICKNKCIDPLLISNISSKEINVSKDKTQRDSCRCVTSIDIGSYNTCSHNCLYCYANYNINSVNSNLLKHNPGSPLLIGNLEPDDKINTRKMESCFNSQRSLL